jgi:hypothetical protein
VPDDAFATRVLERIGAVEVAAAADRQRTGQDVLGRHAVLTQKCSDRPATREPRRRLDPRVAARNKWRRIEALMRNREFRAAYAAARVALVAGIRDVIFPAGTYWLRSFVRVGCPPEPQPG